ncbi:MAG: acyltransferase [Proteobacteria bacterium]|nr:acyltransferase [Pseudomonadota bacterium]
MAQATAEPSGRLDWLDALRGWAIFGVVLVHSSQTAHVGGVLSNLAGLGRFGVQLFFIVSALTISLTYESHIRRFGDSLRPQFGWLIKRFFRIAPLYYIAILVNTLYRLLRLHWGLPLHDHFPLPSDIVANIFFVHTWVPSAINSVVPGGWSIAVEMFFYALVPLIWLVKPTRTRIGFLVLFGAAGLATTAVVSRLTTGSYDFGAGEPFLYYWFPTQAPVFAIGLIFYFLHGPKLKSGGNTGGGLLWLSLFVVFLATFLLLWTKGLFFHVLTAATVGFAFILLILAMEGIVRPLLVHRFSIGLGRASYSIYIVHFIVLDGIEWLFQSLGLYGYLPAPLRLVAVFALAVALANTIAMFTKRVIEDPAIAFGHALGMRVSMGGANAVSGRG